MRAFAQPAVAFRIFSAKNRVNACNLLPLMQNAAQKRGVDF